ncbi:hypothetical protein HN51_023499 [Arachis hypogaea]
MVPSNFSVITTLSSCASLGWIMCGIGQLPDQEHVAKMLIEPQNGVNYVLLSKIRDAGYVPESKYALYDLELENKQELLSYHSEKLAIAFVLTRNSELPIRNSG